MTCEDFLEALGEAKMSRQEVFRLGVGVLCSLAFHTDEAEIAVIAASLDGPGVDRFAAAATAVRQEMESIK